MVRVYGLYLPITDVSWGIFTSVWFPTVATLWKRNHQVKPHKNNNDWQFLPVRSDLTFRDSKMLPDCLSSSSTFFKPYVQPPTTSIILGNMSSCVLDRKHPFKVAVLNDQWILQEEEVAADTRWSPLTWTCRAIAGGFADGEQQQLETFLSASCKLHPLSTMSKMLGEFWIEPRVAVYNQRRWQRKCKLTKQAADGILVTPLLSRSVIQMRHFFC